MSQAARSLQPLFSSLSRQDHAVLIANNVAETTFVSIDSQVHNKTNNNQ